MGDSLPEVEYSEQAAERLGKLEGETADRIVSKLNDVIWKPEHYLKRLRGSGSADYRFRVGDYRVLIDWRRADGVLFVTDIGHRRNIYE